MMSDLVRSFALTLVLTLAIGPPPARPASEAQQEPPTPEQSQEPPPQKEQAPAESTEEAEDPSGEEEEEGDEGEEDDEEKEPKRRPGLLPLEQLAEVELGGRAVGPALFYEDTFILVTEAGEAMSIDVKTGEPRWKLGLPGTKLLPPCLLPQGLLILARSGTLFLIDPATGTIQTEHAIDVSPALPPVWSESVVFFATSENDVVAYDIDEAREKWRTKLQDAPLAMAAGGSLLAVSDRSGGLNALETEGGELQWQFQGRGNFAAPAAFDAEGQRLFLGDTGGFFYSLSAHDGKVHYRWANGAAIPLAVLVEEQRVYVATYANTLFCYRLSNGHELWRTNLPGRPASTPARARRRIVVVTLDGQVAEFTSGGKIGQQLYAAPAEILPAPSLMPGGMALPLRSGKLLLLRTTKPPPKIDPSLLGEPPEGDDAPDDAPDDDAPTEPPPSVPGDSR
jgi:hypothetical protein